MTLEEFITALKEEVQGIVNENCLVLINDIQKNNVGQVPVLNIMEKGVPISPNFYLNDLYEEFQKAEVSLVELAKKLVEIHYENITCSELGFSLQFQGMEEFRSRLFFRLVNYEKNRELLEKTPHIKILDMALVYYLLAYEGNEVVGSIRMGHAIFRHFGWNEEEMYQEVLANTVRLFPERNTTFSKLVEEMADAIIWDVGISSEDLAGFFWQKEFPIVLTNTGGVNGAAVIVYPDLLRRIAEKIGYNLFLLPSSVHECLVLPDNGEFSLKELENMVITVNRESVSPEEFLSDHVYYYNADLDRLLIAGADVLDGKEEGNHV